jgi:hypothetical protein
VAGGAGGCRGSTVSCCELAAGGIDVGAAVAAHRRSDAEGGELAAELLETHPSAGGVDVLLARADDGVEGIAAVQRHELVA